MVWFWPQAELYTEQRIVQAQLISPGTNSPASQKKWLGIMKAKVSFYLLN